MSRIVVIGAHGRTGKLIVDQLLKAGDNVVATIRNPKHMAALVKAGAETVILDLDKSTPRDFAVSFTGADAIIFAAGSAEGESSAIDRKGVTRTVNAAEKAGVKRYIAISSIGGSTPVPKQWSAMPGMKEYFAAKKAANKKLRSSTLDWTIIEPGELTQGKPTGKVTLSTGALTDEQVSSIKIPRADVAAVAVASLKDKRSIGKTFQIVGGTTDVAKAIASAK